MPELVEYKQGTTFPGTIGRTEFYPNLSVVPIGSTPAVFYRPTVSQRM